MFVSSFQGHAGSKVVSGIEKGAEVVGTVCGLITC